MSPTIHEEICKGAQILGQAAIENAVVDAGRLMQFVMDVDHAGLIARHFDPIPADAAKSYRSALRRRAAGEPVSRIVGTREFFGNRFAIDPAVLDPRPETELLVECALRDFGHAARLLFCDMGTGSGAVGISLLKAMPNARCVAVDISQVALEVARRNSLMHGVGDRFECTISDYYSAISERFDFVVSNPPYIALDSIRDLPPEVRRHDPLVALNGGEDGLQAYRMILDDGGRHLRRGGRLYLEIGDDQRDDCITLALVRGWRFLVAVEDLAAIPRVLSFDLPKNEENLDKIKNDTRKCLEFPPEQASFRNVQGRHTVSRPWQQCSLRN